MSQYLDFVDSSYRPGRDDLVCLFRFEPAGGISRNEAVGRIAAESSNGTWTELATLNERMRRIRGRAFSVRGNRARIAYPMPLFESGSMPQLFSSVAGNIFGMKALKNLRLEDIDFPDRMIRAFPGPQFGIRGVRGFMKAGRRPLTATVPKPKVGMTAAEHAKTGYEAWVGGVDFLKDDENLTDQVFNRFRDRARLCARMRDRAEKETGEVKEYFINITAESGEMLRRMKVASDHGFRYVMVDIVTAGWAGLQAVREAASDTKQAIHAHRAMHAAFTRNPRHGISMTVLAKCARLAGVDNIHIGTVVGKLVSPKHEVLALEAEMEQQHVSEDFRASTLREDWLNIKPVLAVSSGGLHPGLVPGVMDMLGNDIVLQLGGGIHGHPMGTRAGAMALRQAIDACMGGVTLKEYAEGHKELKAALDRWGARRPV